MCVGEGIRHHDQAGIWLACVCGNHGLELGRVAYRCRCSVYRKGCGSSLKGLEVILGIGRRCGVKQQGDAGYARCDLLKQLQPFAGNCRLHDDESGDITARPRKARDEATTERIGDERENDGDAACLS